MKWQRNKKNGYVPTVGTQLQANSSGISAPSVT